MILIIDNYDSFTYNIVQYLYEIGQKEIKVYRNDKITVKEINSQNPDHIIISPGPKTPKQAGVSKEVIKYFAGKIPILGICLGHQAIGEVFGGSVVSAGELVHGKMRDILHDGKTIFSGINSPFKAARYHSLAISRNDFPDCLEISAVTDDGEIMGVRHKEYYVEGVQFHPESILTASGKKILSNFVYGYKEGVSVKKIINKVVSGNSLSFDEAENVMNMIMSGEVTPAQLASLLTALRLKGETVDEIAGFAKVMREKAEKVKVPDGIVVDTCGTGGDSKSTFNISTGSMFVVAGADVMVAKHGNKAISSKSGSADVLEKLGINIQMHKTGVEQCIKDVGIGFMFAPLFHKAMKYAIGPRREMGIRTIFNVLGPLSNPAGTKYQLIGVYDSKLTEKIAEVLGKLGAVRALVVAAFDGLDEITLTGKTKVSELSNGAVNTYTVDPEELGFSLCSIEDLQVQNVNESAQEIIKILKGEKGPKADIVILNAAAALIASGAAQDMKQGIEKAKESINSGKAYKKLQKLIEYTNKKL
ncbi:bifunctional anthranilate synthase component II/anthranilate phosphoribosyltransferase [bacterium]